MDESYYPELSAVLKHIERSIARNLLDSLTTSQNISGMLLSVVSAILSAATDESVRSLLQSAEALSSISDQWKEACENGAYSDSAIPVSEEVIGSIEKMAPFVPEQEQERFHEIVSPPQGNERKFLTADNFKWLLTIIIPIIFSFVVNYLPDENEEEMLRMQKEQNEIGRNILAALRQPPEEDMFEKFLEYLDENGIVISEPTDAIPDNPDAVPEQSDVLKEGVDVPIEPVDSEAHCNDSTGQNYNQDSKN